MEGNDLNPNRIKGCYCSILVGRGQSNSEHQLYEISLLIQCEWIELIVYLHKTTNLFLQYELELLLRPKPMRSRVSILACLNNFIQIFGCLLPSGFMSNLGLSFT